MTIYTFNLLVGFEPNGVDIGPGVEGFDASGHRPAKSLSLTLATTYKLDYYLSLGHRYEELSLHAYLSFTDQDSHIPSLTVGALHKI